MKPAIVFREGCSGHFLYALITNHPADSVNFRMADYHENAQSNIYLTHQVNYDYHKTLFDPLLRILPTKKIYNVIYNIFMKKTLVEEFNNTALASWTQDCVFWYDKCYYQIKYFYQAIMQDITINQYPDIVDFDRVLDQHYIQQILKNYFNRDLDNNQQQLLKNYAQLQLPVDLINDSAVSMNKILEPITDQMLMQNPWFWAYCIFKFEQNNGLSEQQRAWTVNNITAVQLQQNLLDIATQYR